MSKRFAVVGSPIAHSKSPVIHSAAYVQLKKGFSYDKIEVQKNHLMQFVETLDEQWQGLSVTAPLKSEAFRLAKESDEISRLTGSSNTLVKVNGYWRAFNTDVFGVEQALRQAVNQEVANIVVIGTGSTATSVIAAVSSLFPAAKLAIAGRNKAAMADLMNFARGRGFGNVKRTTISKAFTRFDLVISTLPAGVIDEQIEGLRNSRYRKPKGIFLDVAYEPWPSKAAQCWIDSGLTTISGIEMLLWQAIAQIRIFVEGDPETEVFNEAAVLLAMRNSIGLI